MKELKVKLTFIEPILGTSPANPDIYREFIGSHAPDAASVEDEVAALGADAVAEKSMTIFPRLDDGTPYSNGIAQIRREQQWKRSAGRGRAWRRRIGT